VEDWLIGFQALRLTMDQATSSMSRLANFITACREGNIWAVYRLKAKGQDLNEGDAEGITGLMMASLNNQLNIVKYLVRQGAIVDAANNYG
jgi:ankyrin repeat protein